MTLFTPTPSRRLNEVTGFVFLATGVLILLSLVSFHATDPSWSRATGAVPTRNLIGPFGAHLSDVLLQAFGFGAYLFPCLVFALGWKWIRSQETAAPVIKLLGSAMLVASACGVAALLPEWRVFDHTILPGGTAGYLLADALRRKLNFLGAAVILVTTAVISLYLVSTFTLATLERWFSPVIVFFNRLRDRWLRYLERRQEAKLERIERKREAAALRAAAKAAKKAVDEEEEDEEIAAAAPPIVQTEDPAIASKSRRRTPTLAPVSETLPWEEPEVIETPATPAPDPATVDEIPICTLEEKPAEKPNLFEFPFTGTKAAASRLPTIYKLPSTDLLNEIPQRSAFDEQELKNVAAAIKVKFEEFNVTGSVVQINPGPVVTTFEYKPEAGIKYSKITNLREDLCLGLQAESILIERIPGKMTIGIEVPNTKREVISLRAVIESEEFENSPSRLTISMGKDISGRIKVASLETMPHALIAGSTGSGKSVMINSLIMSILYKATPDEVRMIMVDPKRVELGIYEGIPHLLTPVITDARKATNALRNAVLEMERRLRLLAEVGARNIDQYNKKIRQMKNEPRSLFEEDEQQQKEELKPLPYILILIDELADLMMLEGRNVEESVTRLAQMARAVGMHLVLATQRPSVDVITGLIKANFPARISFRVATRVDSRTVLDVMGAEHLLGKGDMLFLPPGSSRLTRVHGAFVTETEINSVVDFWKAQARPEYDQSYLIAPPSEDGAAEMDDEPDGEQDPMYEEALRVVLEMGKASTSTLQRRLRLGYGRAARILDMMYRDGIIGPPDGSKPREVLKRPEWLREVDHV
ncbi:MAG TPA: DNA translocase FtsK 4TM domain-containing protein [Bryobacteraceae bacterium]|nr:DNA translocase FtsK 4TM domain-containing protein [Bryobacteraceae bacterium]